ncbi:hypothetical protein [Aulosira sp. FACHB-615]|uniref:hypothetical protein n=1 Tax=Aulosira sp. FACHB-615 TaxID=2692777 RepID=UPI001688EA7C|nr:hypothetical protein [Aulosira sp. FACHB-615]MBD2492627.1 hypothetical protein [Aulosira sp. FACHB-615]
MRESCISHAPRQPIAVVREDYYLLMNKDCVAAAILNIFEYWANGAIACNSKEENPCVGVRTAKEFEEMLLGMSTEKHIRKRLHQLEEMGFIQTRQPVAHRKSLEYRFMVSAVQKALNKANGQTTEGMDESQRSNDRSPNGQTTAGMDESQRSNDRCTIYRKYLIKEDQEESPPTPQRGECVEDGESLEPDQSNAKPVVTLSTQPELLVQSENPSCGSIVPAAFDKIEQLNKVTDAQIKAWFLEVYQQEKPSNFTEHKEISSAHLKKIKQLIKEHPQDAIAKFKDALIWVREQNDGWWRDKQISLSNLMTNGKVAEYADKHATAIKYDRAYKDRVEGRAPSKDLKRIMPDAIATQAQYEEAYEAERRKQELIDVYDYRPVIARLRRF